jgi:hypothetical protein
MVMQSLPDQTGIRARQVPQSVRFLRALGVRATRLAGIFGDSADNIRHIDSRSYKDEPANPKQPIIDEDDLALLRLSPDGRKAESQRQIQGLRLRSKQDLDQVEATVWAIFQNHKSVGLQEGYDAMLLMLPGVANARHGQALRIRLLIEEKLAWFALPLNRIDQALRHARRSMRLAVRAFRESAGEKGYLMRYGESALVASICLQKMHRPEHSFAFIKAADEACIAAGQLAGSEHLRQRGAAFMHMGRDNDDRAERALVRAPERMRRKNEAEHPVDLAMNGLRQRAFLDPAWGWDKSLELIADVKAAYGERSMQYGVAAKSAALVGLKLATQEATEISLKLLDSISPAPPHVISNILSITPDLKLSPEDRDHWLRFAMNETPLPARK